MTPQAFIDRVLVQGLRCPLRAGRRRFPLRCQTCRRLRHARRRGRRSAASTWHACRATKCMASACRVRRCAPRSRRATWCAPRRCSGRPLQLSGHVLHGRKLGRDLGFRTLNLRFGHPRPAAMGIFVVRVHGLAAEPLPGVASLGVRPTIDDAGRVLLEVALPRWPTGLGPEGGYGRLRRVELLHKLHDERQLRIARRAARRHRGRRRRGAGVVARQPADAIRTARLRRRRRRPARPARSVGCRPPGRAGA